MATDHELREVARKWREVERDEELSVYKLLLDEIRETPNDMEFRYQEQRVVPKLAIAAFQLRNHSRALLQWTRALTGLTVVLAGLTAALVVVSLRG